MNAARLVNFYSEPAPRNSRAPAYNAGVIQGPVNGPFYGTPGQKAFVASLGTSIRCARFALGYIYVLTGTSLYRVDRLGTATLCTGDAIASLGYAMMTDNGIQLTLLSQGPAGIGYVVVGTVIAKITSSAWPANGVSSIDTIDGYTVFTSNDGAQAVYDTATTITNITNANPAVVTVTAHPYVDNDQVLITAVAGMGQVNDRSFSILTVDANSFQLVGIDSTSYSGYTGGGHAQKIIAQAGGQWFISALNDSAAIDPLDFATAESNPDALVRCLVNNRDVLLFGTNTIEPWQDVGTSPFPFQRVTGAIIQKGCLAPLSPARLNTAVFWLGDDHIVYKMDNYTPVRVSDFPQEDIIREAPTAADAFGMTYSQDGHNFYALTLPTANRTLVWDDTVGRWHERQSGTTLAPTRWNVTCIVTCFDEVFCGTEDGAFSYLDLDTYTELGKPIRRVAVTPPFYPNGLRAAMSLVELECELGVGLVTPALDIPGGPEAGHLIVAGFTQPATGGAADVQVSSGLMTLLSVGAILYVTGAGFFIVTIIGGSIVEMRLMADHRNAVAGTAIPISSSIRFVNTQGTDPQVMFRFSDDGTKSWKNQRLMAIGKTGDAIDRAIVRRLGQFRQRSLEFSISDPVFTGFYGIRVEGAQGTS